MRAKGKLKLNWMTSRHRQSKNLHAVDHKRTYFLLVDGKLEVKPFTLCGQYLNGKTILFLTDEEMHDWAVGMSKYNEAYGCRDQCNWCVRWND